ncbi:NAD(P)/FAD-dependent oxidoreductase [Gulosibacter sp. ACHW.36C]|uniref:FAD-binding oxidoreductase n=1 Tax=Gulosibacter sediminis TaxID=1729695 RepID=A0ABY4MW55_9MICO|nr:FAD-dependent oxidoreductase [Gulosibacter sediminis]UQN14658.1 FAD-binding oxidoreductase [Gulosibacter sediminis]
MRVGVIGAGVVGLSTAWHLVRGGAEVTVLDRTDDDRARASWGNAGHIVPAMSMPLPERRNLTAAATSFYKRSAAVTAPRSYDSETLRFLAEFAGNARHRKWMASLRETMPLNLLAIAAFEELESAGVETTRESAPFTSALTEHREAEGLFAHYAAVAEAGYDIDLRLLAGASLTAVEPLARLKRFGVELSGQSLVHPPKLLQGLREAVESLGVTVDLDIAVDQVERDGDRVIIIGQGARHDFDAVVIATGAALGRLAKPHGVRRPVVAGFGYSMSVEVPENTRGMLYFPSELIASTRLGDRLRVSSLMQIDRPDSGSRAASHARLLRTAQTVLPDADWRTVDDRWFGARPVSSDGKPLLGATDTPGIFVNGGHGMWGVTLGPITGKLVAASVLSSGRTRPPRGTEATR